MISGYVINLSVKTIRKVGKSVSIQNKIDNSDKLSWSGMLDTHSSCFVNRLY